MRHTIRSIVLFTALTAAGGGLAVAGRSETPPMQVPELLRPLHVYPLLLERPEKANALEHFEQWKAAGRPALPLNPWREQTGVVPRAAGEDDARADVTTRTFNVYNFSAAQYEEVPATLEISSTHVNLYVADDQLGPSQVTTSMLETLRVALEDESGESSVDPAAGIIDLEHQFFGESPDIEGTGKLNVLVTDIQDGWNNGCACAYTAGFFDPNDLDLTDPDSNQADVLYVDAYPSLYNDKGANNPTTVLSTLAHEHQHLIHANYNHLYLFQNEGQSEWAQGLCGYPSRSIQYLDTPGETNQPLYGWRSGADTAFDYQRASLFHFFLESAVGAERVGAITHAAVGGWAAYDGAIEPTTRAAHLQRFHIANWLNQPLTPYAYLDQAHQNLRMLTPTIEVGGTGTLPRLTRSLEYGGAEYLRWTGVQDLNITLEGDSATHFVAILSRSGASPSVDFIQNTSASYSGTYDSIVLMATNTEPMGSDELSGGSRAYSVTATWTPTNLSTETLAYFNPASVGYAVSIPYGSETKGAVRFSPYVTGSLTAVDLGLTTWLSGADNPAGTGTLRIALYDSVPASGTGTNQVLVPGTEIAHIDVPFAELQSGPNHIDVSAENWLVTGGEDFQLVFEVVDGSSDAGIAFDLDSGSKDTADLNYYPARTHRYFTDSGWNHTWQDNGNITVSATVSGTLTAAPDKVTTQSPNATGGDYRLPLLAFWGEAAGASSYQIQVDDQSDFSSPLQDQSGLLETWVELTGLAPSHTYYWRTRGANVMGPGEWSDTQTFHTRANATGEELFSYYTTDNLPWLAVLPFYDETKAAVRLSPTLTGEVRTVSLDLSSQLNGGDNPSGSGQLQLSLYKAELTTVYGPEAEYEPGERIGVQLVAFGDLHSGLNHIDIAEGAWPVTPGDYLLVIEVKDTTGGSAIALNLDNGSELMWNQDYYPSRTFRYFGNSDSWDTTWYNHGNLAVSANAIESETPTPTPLPETATPAPTPTLPASTVEPESPTPTGTPWQSDDPGCSCTQLDNSAGQSRGISGLSTLLGFAGAGLILVARRRRR